jgi:hypothetical protein
MLKKAASLDLPQVLGARVVRRQHRRCVSSIILFHPPSCFIHHPVSSTILFHPKFPQVLFNDVSYDRHGYVRGCGNFVGCREGASFPLTAHPPLI